MKLSFQLALRQPDVFRNFRNFQRFADMRVDQFNGVDDALQGRVDPMPEGGSLCFVGWSRDMMHHLIANFRRQALAMFGRDKREHEVNAACTTGAGHQLSIDRIELLDCLDIRKLFLKAGKVRPMRRGDVSVEQPGAGQQVTANLDSANPRTEARL